jgi:putative transferase (TIGR04331 family)
MFLITTADQRFWKTGEDVLFLGEWCKVYDQKHVWGGMSHQTLPYHWDDRKIFSEDYRYLEALYRKQLRYLSGKLNVIHDVDRSVRYWKIIIGPWLFFAISVLLERYLSIKSAMNSGLVSHTWISSSPFGLGVANDFSQFERWCCADIYNHYLYGEIIEASGGISYEKISTCEELISSEGEKHQNLKSNLKKISKSALHSMQRVFVGNGKNIVFVSSQLGVWDLIRLQLSIGQFPYLFPPEISADKVPADVALREKIRSCCASEPFEIILEKLIPEIVPSVYLEGYSKMKQKSLEKFPKTSKVILTALGLYHNEGFKFWAANQVESGAKILSLQHGGLYGSACWSQYESIEVGISDKFYTWGWGKGETKTIPMESWKLSKGLNGTKPDPKGSILWVGMTVPRYTITVSPCVIGPQVISYIEDQERFVNAVSQKVRDLLLMKVYSIEWGWKDKERWKDFLPNLNVYRGKKNMTALLGKSRLCIGTYNSTGYLETFSMNFPTLLFWDPSYWELRDSAKPYFDDLRNVGILHDTPESAAAKLNEIFEDPMSWWMIPKTQKVKDEFCRQFAWTSKNWHLNWKKELLKRAGE